MIAFFGVLLVFMLIMAWICWTTGSAMQRNEAEQKKRAKRRDRVVEFHTKKSSRMAFAARTITDFDIDAEANRRQVVKDRELLLINFEAHQECPNCGDYGFWLIENVVSPWDLERKCGACEHIWLQKK